jgi:hypothetical protein
LKLNLSFFGGVSELGAGLGLAEVIDGPPRSSFRTPPERESIVHA